MRIQIAERLRPYSHTAGTHLILPGSYYSLQIFPCLIRIYSLFHFEPLFIDQLELDLIGPVQDFTIQQDLEKGKVTVWGQTKTGFVRYHLISQDQTKGIRLFIEKAPSSGLPIIRKGVASVQYIHAKEEMILFNENHSFSNYVVPAMERLSLGNHRAQDWDLVKRRVDLVEIFPIWNRLGQMIPSLSYPITKVGTLALLEQCRDAIEKKDKENIVPFFQILFQAAFYDVLMPRLIDDQYQGLISVTEKIPISLSPLLLLTEGSQLIRSLFVQYKDNKIILLPVLPPEFHCGRFLHISVPGGILHIEWSKKLIRRLIFIATETREQTFCFHKVKQCRLRKHQGETGRSLFSEETFFVEKNCHYFFDNFQ